MSTEREALKADLLGAVDKVYAVAAAEGVPILGLTQQVDVFLLLGRVAVLSDALNLWSTRDDSRPQPEVRQAANTAIDAITEALQTLHRLRGELVTQIRQYDDASDARVDAKLAEVLPWARAEGSRIESSTMIDGRSYACSYCGLPIVRGERCTCGRGWLVDEVDGGLSKQSLIDCRQQDIKVTDQDEEPPASPWADRQLAAEDDARRTFERGW